jgi:hypothetical protein
MDAVRLVPSAAIPQRLPCCRCLRADRRWDRIAGKAYCPNCQEMLALSEGPALVERMEKRCCAVCGRQGTACFLSFPLRSEDAIALDLCPEHLRGLVARRLGPYAFNRLRRRLGDLGLNIEHLFLLHGAFYDRHGRALQPAHELE